jgi:glycosidase
MRLSKLFFLSFFLVGCVGEIPGRPISLSENVSTSSIVESTSLDIPHYDDYEQYANSWSQPGHLYIHYRRLSGNVSEYNNWALWIWQNAPKDLEGAMYCVSDPTVQNRFHPMSTSWMTNIGGTGYDYDESGRIADIDLYADIKGGKTGASVSFAGASKVGFLIALQSSMDGSSHWTSDGGANSYIYDFSSHFRANNSMHIYAVQGSVGDYSFYLDPNVIPNPTVDDKTGQYVSEYPLQDSSSSTIYPNSPTSQLFYENAGIGYQIFVASFADSNGDGLGDIRGIINKLDYLQSLNINVLWLTPIQESESYHGYDITDFYKVDSKFGSESDYRELIQKVHEKGMYIIMDLVINHTSKNNTWFKLSQKADKVIVDGKELNYRNMYHWKFKGDLVPKCTSFSVDTPVWSLVPVQNHPDWYKDGESDYYYFAKFGSGMVELNYDSQLTRDLMLDMGKYWLGFGLDGFRLDAIKHIYMRDESSVPSSISSDKATSNIVVDVGNRTFYDEELEREVSLQYDYSSDKLKNVNWWKEFAYNLKAIYPDTFLVGENFDGWAQRISPYYQSIDSQFDFNLYYSLQELSAPQQNIGNIASNYNYFKLDRPNFINGAFTSNHDVERAINHISETKNVTGTSKQIGLAKYAAAVTILQPGLSWIYYGDELGMSGNTNTHISLYENANNEDIWYRQPFKWGFSDNSLVDYKQGKYTIQWDDYNKTIESSETQKNNDASMFKFYQSLTSVKNLPDFPINGTYSGINGLNVGILAFKLSKNGVSYNIYINGTENIISYSSVGTEVLKLNNSTSSSLGAYGVYITKG